MDREKNMNYEKVDDKVVFECGCSLPIKNGLLQFCADKRSTNFNVDLNCTATYKTLSDGLTEGVFQLCSQLGHSYTKKLKPETINHIAALGAILRPSCLDSKLEDGKSLTEHFVRRKNAEEDVPKFHPIIDQILNKTFGVLVYQEQSMKIAQQCAGFNLQEADSLRKAIGKKIPEEMHKSKILFLEKAKIFGVLTEEEAKTIFDQIEASQRYAFNLAHAVSYGITGYITAYIKTHFPIQFYKNWLANEKDRVEYTKIINEAKIYEITVNTPNIQHLKAGFYNIDKNIYFGIGNIKGILKSDIQKLASLLSNQNWSSNEIGKSIGWLDFLYHILDNISSKTVEGLIKTGALDCFKKDRASMLSEYEKFSLLTGKKEKPVYKSIEGCDDLLCLLKAILDIYKKKYEEKIIEYDKELLHRKTSGKTYKSILEEPKINRRADKISDIINLLEQPVYDIMDTVDSIIYGEEELLGVAITKHISDSIQNCAETHSCMDITNGYKGYAVLRVKIDRVGVWKCKSGANAGKNMCYLELSDGSYKLESAKTYTKEYAEYKHLLTKDNLVFVSGNLDKDGTFIVKKVYSIS